MIMKATDTVDAPATADTQIAEILHPNGAVRFRYAQKRSGDKTRWVHHGPFTEFYEDGTVRSKGQYTRGKESGLWQDFYPNGQLAAKGFYVDGDEFGRWSYWDEHGNPVG
ncbi:MAG: toxin-antitoxin system YwqK family antitoxin [Gammaproteobacteria bacterium]